ncbi:hypothetical protein PJL18_03959 [Paenarthrobacter nicotinovorans]|nr:hypothetical protein [Paenarthrobacter nicotinovorans]
MEADFWMLKWLSAEVKIRSRSRRCGRRASPFAARSLETAWLRAISKAWKLDWLPPEVKTPSASALKPMRSAVQSIRRRSIMVAPALWSQVSMEEFTAESTASPTKAGMTTGQFKCAA